MNSAVVSSFSSASWAFIHTPANPSVRRHSLPMSFIIHAILLPIKPACRSVPIQPAPSPGPMNASTPNQPMFSSEEKKAALNCPPPGKATCSLIAILWNHVDDCGNSCREAAQSWRGAPGTHSPCRCSCLDWPSPRLGPGRREASSSTIFGFSQNSARRLRCYHLSLGSRVTNHPGLGVCDARPVWISVAVVQPFSNSTVRVGYLKSLG